jgi:ubiquinone/menaquinone biosynthesis C-methylase UbiE
MARHGRTSGCSSALDATWRACADRHRADRARARPAEPQLAHTYGCRVDGIDLTPELVETGRVLTERCKLADRVVLQVANALELPYPDQTFDVVWCQNVTMSIADKAGFLAGIYRVLKRGGLFTATEYSNGPGGDIIFPVPWAYDASINFLETADVIPHSRMDELLR